METKKKVFSSKPQVMRKQVAMRALHKKTKAVSGHLSEKLRKELNCRAVPLRKGDIVRLLRGHFKGKEGKITGFDRANSKIFVEKVIRKKSDGAEYNVAIDASKILVMEVEKGDRKRFKEKR